MYGGAYVRVMEVGDEGKKEKALEKSTKRHAATTAMAARKIVVAAVVDEALVARVWGCTLPNHP